MAEVNNGITPQMKALKTTDLSPFIRMSGLMAPRMIDAFLPVLNEKQRNAINKVMPVGGKKRFFVHLAGTPTPPIVIQMSQPIKMDVVPEDQIKNLKLKGITLTLSDMQALIEKRIGKLVWQLKGQLGTLMSLSGMAIPILQLGPTEIKDMKNRAMKHFKPLLDMMPK
jgi:hypothetical protein